MIMQRNHWAADPANVFSKLTEMICQGSEAARLYAAICTAATILVPGCDHASLQVRRNGRYVPLGASGPVARHIGDRARATGEGPPWTL
jgi:hypothetical protein